MDQRLLRGRNQAYPRIKNIQTPDHKNDEKDTETDLISTISKHPLVDTSLRLSEKRIKWLPKQLFQLSYIEYLYLNDNFLQLLPERFFEKMPNLIYLDLRNNDLNEIPKFGLKNHKCLAFLLVSGNNLSSLPLELGFVKTLKNLSWHGNPIENVEMSVMRKGLPSLKKKLREVYKERNNETNK